VTRPDRHVFPLVPRFRVSGLPFGEHRSVRRGPGSDVAGSRAYHPGDPVSAIDWYASARLSAAQGDAAFIVRERFADEAPRVVIVYDRRPSMALYPPPFPWLSKPAACARIVDAIVVSALAARSEIGYVEHAANGGDHAEPYWLPPRSRGRGWEIEQRVASQTFDAPPDALESAISYLARMRADLPAGSFVFVLSDFLAAPSLEAWRRALSLRWDVVPVVVQDPTWEQSFPDAHSVVVPFADPESGGVVSVRLSAEDVRGRRRAHEERLHTMLRDFRTLGLDPVVIGTSNRAEIDRAFLSWAELRRQARRRAR
jgi:uncharacterized protein (DUF58 family)